LKHSHEPPILRRDSDFPSSQAIVLNERHLKRFMNECVRYDHEDRTHLALGKETPAGRKAAPVTEAGSRIIAMPKLRGLHHRCDLAC
jgi:hypothetical protein